MMPKPIGYTHHAKQQLQARQITRQDVRWVLAQGIRTPLGDHLYEARGYLQKHEARLIVREDETHILVITVMGVE